MAKHSDSKPVIKALSSYVIDSKMIWGCRNKLNEVGKKNKVFSIWVPDYLGIKGNEEDNTLAKEGARMSLIGPEPFCCIGKCTYKKEFLEKEKAEKEKLGGISQGWIIPLSYFWIWPFLSSEGMIRPWEIPLGCFLLGFLLLQKLLIGIFTNTTEEFWAND